jgi:cell wall-associated NlpC family hydrolase
VEKQLGKLALEKTQMVDKYDQIQSDVAAKQKAADAASEVAAQAQQKYEVARSQLVGAIVSQYESGGFGSAGALLASPDKDAYLNQAQLLTLIRGHNDEVVATATSALRTATSTRAHADQLLATAKERRAALLAQKQDVDKQISKYKTLLASLSANEQALVQHNLNPRVDAKLVVKQQDKYAKTPKGTPAAAAQAVKFALGQVGKPYVYGAAGPGSYDCSGLTMAAYATAGISLPHSAAQQYNYGHHVSASQLKPGDLMFYYSPIGHVTIYIGDNLMVSAPQDGEDVSVVPANTGGDYVGATRLVG